MPCAAFTHICERGRSLPHDQAMPAGCRTLGTFGSARVNSAGARYGRPLAIRV